MRQSGNVKTQRKYNLGRDFANIKPPIKSAAASRILRLASHALVRERIRPTRYELDKTARTLLATHLQLSSVLAPRDWELIDQSTAAQEQLLLKRNTTRQTKKYDNLARKKPVATPLNPDRTVINLLGESINDSTKTVLTKGLNFAPTPCSIPYQDFIGGIEPAIRKLPKEAAEEIRSQVTHFLKKAVPPKPNLSKEEKEALKELKTRKDIAILPVDKGNATTRIYLPRSGHHGFAQLKHGALL
ncbi:hypothetical protein J437_LFUL006366 [Ladona fulva]|uniref:Uncharacterized protein n=1 Tax=Ladona fulva TaxID=123851 RepID=A0A8K0K0N5_LADFU|nr:hypothetical protein J437_LFUL006366 [Ladona fulva]